MTKEDLFREDWWNYQEDSGQKYIIQSNVFRKLEKFFDSNVCIPKGENRHPYADVLHKWAENSLKDLPVFNEDHGIFYLSILDEYRIKPLEPVYEYLWYDVDGDTKWMTLDEAKEFERPWFWAKETSRMRQ